MTEWTDFLYKKANYKIYSDHPEIIKQEIINQRTLLEEYLRAHPGFEESLTPLKADEGAPEIVRLMCHAAGIAGVGPMAAVAGTIAQLAAQKAIDQGAKEAIVNNGGDLYLHSSRQVSIGLYAGTAHKINKLAFLIKPEQMPLGLCSSSSTMGHSLSFGRCQLACVLAGETPLADAVATALCNAVGSTGEIEEALNHYHSLPGVQGLLVVLDNRIGLKGDLPPLIKNEDPHSGEKIALYRHF